MKRVFSVLFLSALIEAVICCSEPKKAGAACCNRDPSSAMPTQLSSPNDPRLGACLSCESWNDNGTCAACRVSVHPTVIQPLAAIDLKTSTLLYGLQAVSPGLCYGLTYRPGSWYASGISFCLNTAKGEGGKVVFPSGIVRFVRWAQIGIGAMCSELNSPNQDRLSCRGLALLGFGLPIE